MQSNVLITGANSGMGKAIALALAKQNYHVIMLCRDERRGLEAQKEVMMISGRDDIDLMLCDLGSQASIHRFYEQFCRKYDQLSVLVNNAGVILPGRHETADGFELQFGVNHLGHFLLTGLLLPQLKKGGPSRIIMVSSGAHKVGKIHFDDLQLKKSYRTFKAYAQSKLANILFTRSLSERLKLENITVNCLHPGAVATQMGINRETGFGKGITKLLKPFFLTPAEGATTTIYLATSPEVERITGEYFYKSKVAKASKRGRDKVLAEKLWHLSVSLTGLDPMVEK